MWPEPAEAKRLASDLHAVSSQQALQPRGTNNDGRYAARDPLQSDRKYVDRSRVARMVESGLESAPDCWAIVTADKTASKQLEVLVAAGATIHAIDALDLIVHVS